MIMCSVLVFYQLAAATLTKNPEDLDTKTTTIAIDSKERLLRGRHLGADCSLTKLTQLSAGF